MATRLDGKADSIREFYQALKTEILNVDSVQLKLVSESEEIQRAVVNDFKFQSYLSGSFYSMLLIFTLNKIRILIKTIFSFLR